jgi:D-alanyl-D-alanine dipeptidase
MFIFSSNMNTSVRFISLVLLLSFRLGVNAQPLVIIATTNQFKTSSLVNEKNSLINLKTLIPSIILDLRYGSQVNFTKQKLYKNATTTYLRRDPANALLSAQSFLKPMGYGIKIFDAYRPYSVTKLMWDLIHDERYVANPKAGSGHNRGISVDLTLVELKTGKELDMGTNFDNFTDSAHHGFTNKLPENVKNNRANLKNVMEQFGFKALETEWWHYSWISNEKYDVLDLSFKKLHKIIH